MGSTKQSSEFHPWSARQYIADFTLSDEEIWRLIESPPWRCVVAWVTRDCQPVACAMAYVVLDGRVMLTSTGNRDKIKALRRNSAISVCFQGRGLKQVTIRGRAELSCDRQLIRRWVEAHIATWQHPPSGAERERAMNRYASPDRYLIIVQPERMRSFDGAKMLAAETAQGKS